VQEFRPSFDKVQAIARGDGVAFCMSEVLDLVDAVPRRIAFESPRPVPCGDGGIQLVFD
jgi:hypothetical protein